MKGARLLVRTLEEHGISTVFGIPGGANLAIYDELRESGLRNILARHECSAAHMADGFARASGNLSACLGTSGPGATNMVTGVCTAYLDSSPMLCLTGQVSTAVAGNDAFQEADVFDLMMPVTKGNFRIRKAEEIPSTLTKAIGLAKGGRPGPVAVDMPSNIMVMEGEVLPFSGEQEWQHTDLERLPEAASAINRSLRPVIIAGGGAKRSGELIVRFAEKIGAPVVTTVMGKGAVPEDHRLVLGTTGMHGRGSSALVLGRADLIIALGTRFSDRTTGKVSDFSSNRMVVHIDIDAAEIGKNVRDAIGLSGDCGDVLSYLMPLVRYSEERAPWLDMVTRAREFCVCDFNIHGSPIKPQKLIYELNRLLPDDCTLVADVGQHQMFAAHFFEIRGGRRFITSGGLGTMGFALPASIGAKMAAPSRTVVCLAGDGGFQMTMAELATAVENRIPLFAVVMNNASLGMVRQLQKHFYGNRIFSVDYNPPDFVKIAEAMGGAGMRVERESELEEAIRLGLRSEVPFVADVIVDREEDCLPMRPPWAGADGAIYGRCNWRERFD